LPKWKAANPVDCIDPTVIWRTDKRDTKCTQFLRYALTLAVAHSRRGQTPTNDKTKIGKRVTGNNKEDETTAHAIKREIKSRPDRAHKNEEIPTKEKNYDTISLLIRLPDLWCACHGRYFGAANAPSLFSISFSISTVLLRTCSVLLVSKIVNNIPVKKNGE